jgi:hypothetical protein
MSYLKHLNILLFLWLSTEYVYPQQQTFSTKLTIGYSYFNINDCDCEYEPKGGYSFDKSFGPVIELTIPISNRLNIETKLGYFRREYESNGINDQYLHDQNYIEYRERIYDSKNKFITASIGYLIGNDKIHISPSLGISIFSRSVDHYDFTAYGFYYPVGSLQVFPDEDPSFISSTMVNGQIPLNWRSISLDIGAAIYIKVIPHFYLKSAAFRKRTFNWIDDYNNPKPHLLEVSLGLGYEFSTLRRKKKTTEMN